MNPKKPKKGQEVVEPVAVVDTPSMSDDTPNVAEEAPQTTTEELSESTPLEEPSIDADPIAEPVEETVEMPEPMDDAFPIKYEVSSRILDPLNDNSAIEFVVSLYGPNDEDLGQRAFMQDLRGLSEDSLDARGEQLGQEMARALYESKNFRKLLKSAPKRATTTNEPQALDFTPLAGELSSTKASIKGLEDTLAQLVERQKKNNYQEELDAVSRELGALKTQFADIQASQRTIVEWLSKLYRALSS